MNRLKTPLLFILIFAALSVNWKMPQKATSIGGPFFKMYIVNQMMLISEYEFGVRIYDISNISSPTRTGFISLQGNADMAVVGSTLYCDSYRDLLVFDLSNLSNVILIDTIKDVFNNITFVNNFRTTPDVPQSNGGISGCSKIGCTQDNTTSPATYGDGRGVSTSGGEKSGGSGQGGSLARFCIMNNYLYCVDNFSLVVFDIIKPKEPVFVTRINLGWGIETIFPYNNYLFIGSRTGMFIYSADDVRKPVYVSQFQHGRACDPVFVEGTLAYITLKSGSACGPSPNAMHVVDISNILKPQLLGSTDSLMLIGPYGLSVENKIAFVCDGEAGVKIINASNPNSMPLIGSIFGIDVVDAIKDGNTLFVIGPYGVYIYDVSDPKNPVKVSAIINGFS